ncbi:hypothetical protein F1721_07530 [Saccharopolyspora hirsuta]|uniref:Uncharacterized protein n=1 Tax=Saccharopolyspora hirsuta TaxID=1837 RepID=A0A5M7C2I3_SACHI|nr:hypothetical protein [Saccharopolyspora hirsuta]KAA5836172.1 hypothetical protein F1721_07530 [Saccharopolyspora hirsuta]
MGKRVNTNKGPTQDQLNESYREWFHQRYGRYPSVGSGDFPWLEELTDDDVEQRYRNRCREWGLRIDPDVIRSIHGLN